MDIVQEIIGSGYSAGDIGSGYSAGDIGSEYSEGSKGSGGEVSIS